MVWQGVDKNLRWETNHSGRYLIILFVCFLAFFDKVDILEFFTNNNAGDWCVRMLYQLGEENSTETRFQKIIQKYKTGGSLSKKNGHNRYGPVKGGIVRLGQ